MKRREFITLVGGAAAAWPFAARAQQADGQRRVGVLQAQPESDADFGSWRTLFAARLRELGWTDGENLRIDYRFGAGDTASMAPVAKELVDLHPDALLAITALSAIVLRQYTLSVPTVFVQVGDPLALGLVNSLARPAGNITGFASFTYDLGGKWIETLKDTVQGLTWAAIFFEAGNPSSTEFIPPIETAAAKLNMRLIPVPVRSVADIESAFAAFTDASHGAIIVLPLGAVVLHRKEIIALAAEHRLPGMYPYRFFTVEGGLMSYGSDIGDQYRSAASYVDRILRGAKPADMPVQLPTKFEFVINLKTAKAIGLTIPGALLARANEVIE
jgi:putative tryptophan/tyrosine transport system substrate-binding protein